MEDIWGWFFPKHSNIISLKYQIKISRISIIAARRLMLIPADSRPVLEDWQMRAVPPAIVSETGIVTAFIK